MEKPQVRLSLLALVVSVVSLGSSVVISLYTYSDSAYREARKPFFEQQLKQYIEAVDVVSKIACLPPEDKEWVASYYRFKQIHWGGMYLVESKEVERKMGEIDNLLVEFDVPRRPLSSDREARLQHASLELAEIMDKDIQKSWKLRPEDDPRSTPSPGRDRATTSVIGVTPESRPATPH